MCQISMDTVPHEYQSLTTHLILYVDHIIVLQMMVVNVDNIDDDDDKNVDGNGRPSSFERKNVLHEKSSVRHWITQDDGIHENMDGAGVHGGTKMEAMRLGRCSLCGWHQ
eukprot:497239-Ditylum_brightwellii.AAC.1